MINILDIEASVRAALGSPGGDLVSFKTIVDSINDGYKDIALKSTCVEIKEEITLRIGERIYFVGSSIVSDLTINDNGQETSLFKVSPEMIGYLSCQVNQVQNNVTYSTRPQYWFQWGNYIAIDPIPEDALVYTGSSPTQTIYIYYSTYPTIGMRYTNVVYADSAAIEYIDGDIVWNKDEGAPYPTDIPDEFNNLLTYYSVYVISIKLKRWETSKNYYNIYITNLNKLKSEYINRVIDNRSNHKI